ncbi:ABC transporter ATP-binding protein [Halococcus agarilyticus]|uniref:ABC transporter ATP-binding protein n=1 Tax=Halococcus agarilyticus TaxID=1232219 RepID=UPI000677B4CA|nr:ABC transporter ATP-binding protein [Halococcus agarilyticus]
MGALQISGLTKRFENDGNEITAADDISIEVADGDFLVLVGPSGCGKTTTLRCVGGLERPSEGNISLDAESLVGKPPQSRNIAMVFQDYALYPHMTARENMSFGLRMNTDLSAEEIETRVTDVAEMMGIESLSQKKPGELSGGQQQRVALGRAIVRDPEVFLMDEPLSNLDAKLRTTMRTEIQELQEKLETTTVYVTHDQTEAMTIGDSIAILNDGKLQQHGTPLECYHMPKNRFVAGFIGSPSMNFVDCTVSDRSLEYGGGSHSMSEDLRADLTDAPEEVTVGIRPSDIEIARDHVDDAVRCEINVVEPLGDVTHVYVTFDDTELVVTVDGERAVQNQRSVRVKFPDDKLHVFDQVTGEAIRNRAPPEDQSDLLRV